MDRGPLARATHALITEKGNRLDGLQATALHRRSSYLGVGLIDTSVAQK